MRILVTGASGTTGHAVIHHLVARGTEVIGLASDEDLRDAEALRTAMAAVERVYHICPGGVSAEVEIGEAVIAAAQASDISLFGYHSVIAPHIEEIPAYWAKMQVQMALMRSGLAFSVVQPALTIEDLLLDPAAVRGAGELALPFAADTPLPWVDIDDVGEAVAILMTRPGQQGGTYELCGTEQPLTPRDLARHMTDAFGMPVATSVCSLDADQTASFRALAGYLGRYGLQAGNPNVLTMLLGRPPTTFEQFITRLAQD